MVVNKMETRNFSANSQVIENGENVNVMNMNASISTDSSLNFSYSIRNKDVYFANKEIIDADYESWKNEVVETIRSEQ